MDEQINKLGQKVAQEAMDVLDGIQNKESKEKNNLNNQIIINQKQNVMARIIEKITLDDVRECLDVIGVNSKYYREDGVVVTSFSADNDFNHDVVLLFQIEGEDASWLKTLARAQGQMIEPGNNAVFNAYFIANCYNCYRRVGTTYVERNNDDGTFHYVFEDNFLANYPISFEAVKEHVSYLLHSSWHFYSVFTTGKAEELPEEIKRSMIIK